MNFHRPCGQAERRVDAKGKEKFVYKVYRTPWEVLRGLEAVREGESYLKEGLSLAELDRVARAESGNDSGKRMQEAKRKLFQGIQAKRKTA